MSIWEKKKLNKTTTLEHRQWLNYRLQFNYCFDWLYMLLYWWAKLNAQIDKSFTNSDSRGQVWGWSSNIPLSPCEGGSRILSKQAYFITKTASIVLTATGRTKGERSWEFKVVRSLDWLARPQPYPRSPTGPGTAVSSLQPSIKLLRPKTLLKNCKNCFC